MSAARKAKTATRAPVSAARKAKTTTRAPVSAARKAKTATRAPVRVATGAGDALVSLPLVGDTNLEDALFYAAVGTVAWIGWIQWPTAGLFATAHALHQRARNVVRTGRAGEAREAVLEVADEVL